MLRRHFLTGSIALLAATPASPGQKLADAAKCQLGVTTGYDPRYIRIPYPNGDVPRTTGVCADVVIRAGRDGLALDLQRLVHEDMLRDFAAYPKTWGMHAPDANIDHRRVLNLEAYFKRSGCAVWTGNTRGDGFPGPFLPGDLLTWLLDARLPHIGVVIGRSLTGAQIVHNIGSGVQQNWLESFRSHRARGHYRWPTA
jgi:uncharacterized protein YijF (DUF1287 family)